jgi:uncharacterized protein YbjT (DUF2867 family)
VLCNISSSSSFTFSLKSNMKVAVVPASTQTGRATIKALLGGPSAPSVVGIYRDLAKAPTDFKSNAHFKAASGDVADSSSLDFSGVDVVVVVTPPQYTETDPVSRARLFAQNVKQAIAKAASVKRVVYISSAGAQHENGTVSDPCFCQSFFRH